MTYLDELPRVEEIEPRTLTEVLIADYRFDQARLRAAVDAVFDAYPALGTVFELRSDAWFSRPGGAWSWGVEPAGGAVEDVVARQFASFDMLTGRLFAVSLLPGERDRLVLTASRLCIDDPTWHALVDDLMRAYRENISA
jgi:hypothetical protein